MAGIVTPPTIIAAAANLDDATQQYLISASLIACAVASLIQISRFHIYKTPFYLGTGLISVAGTSFGIVPVAQKYIANQYTRGYCETIDGVDQPCPDAYGRLIGTCAVTALVHMCLSFVPPKTLKKLFPPMITGQVLLFIGANLVSSSIEDWAGSSGQCSSSTNTIAFYKLCPNIDVPRPYPWGNAHFIGLGFSVFISIILIERFGAPLMRTSGVVLGLLVGIIISAATGYWDGSTIKAAPVITFVWTTTFKLGFDATLILPLLAVVIVLVLENIGDLTATCDVSKVPVEGREFESRIQGGVLADGLNSLISVLMTNTPLSTFAQNNGTIALTGVATRSAGYFACGFLLIAGIIGKFGAVIVAIPPAVMGAMKTFLFASVAVSGLRLLAVTTWDRRSRFILTCSVSLGLASLVVPDWFSTFFTYSGSNKALQGLIDAVVIVVETSYAISVSIAVTLNLVMPASKEKPEGIVLTGAEGLPLHNISGTRGEVEVNKPGPKADS